VRQVLRLTRRCLLLLWLKVKVGAEMAVLLVLKGVVWIICGRETFDDYPED
jgi:hypothetical protein